MKYDRKILTFLKFSDLNFSRLGLTDRDSNASRQIVDFARIAIVSFGEYRSFKTP